jgi:hypothetical protein
MRLPILPVQQLEQLLVENEEVAVAMVVAVMEVALVAAMEEAVVAVMVVVAAMEVVANLFTILLWLRFFSSDSRTLAIEMTAVMIFSGKIQN